MKNTFFLLMLICFSAKAQTTLEEYTYVTEGYGEDLTSGRDVKTGYKVKFVGQVNDDIRKCSLSKLIRSNGTEACGIICYWSDENSKKYYCLPHPKSIQGIHEMYFSDLRGKVWVYERAFLISYCLSRYLDWK